MNRLQKQWLASAQSWLLLASHSAFMTHKQLNRVTTLSAEAAPLQRKIHGGAPES